MIGAGLQVWGCLHALPAPPRDHLQLIRHPVSPLACAGRTWHRGPRRRRAPVGGCIEVDLGVRSRCSRGLHPHLMQNQRGDGCRRAFLTWLCLCSRAVVGWLGAGLGGRWRSRAWSARGASRFGQCGRARNRRGAVAGRQNGPALHATPAPMYAVILRVTRGPCGRLARVGVQSRVEWCFPKWAEVFCSLACLLEAHTKITVLPPTGRLR